MRRRSQAAIRELLEVRQPVPLDALKRTTPARQGSTGDLRRSIADQQVAAMVFPQAFNPMPKTLEEWFDFVKKASPLDDADLEEAFNTLREGANRELIKEVEDFVYGPVEDGEDSMASYHLGQQKAAKAQKEIARGMSAAGARVGWTDPVKPYGSKLQLTIPNAFAHLIDAWAAAEGRERTSVGGEALLKGLRQMMQEGTLPQSAMDSYERACRRQTALCAAKWAANAHLEYIGDLQPEPGYDATDWFPST